MFHPMKFTYQCLGIDLPQIGPTYKGDVVKPVHQIFDGQIVIKLSENPCWECIPWQQDQSSAIQEGFRSRKSLCGE